MMTQTDQRSVFGEYQGSAALWKTALRASYAVGFFRDHGNIGDSESANMRPCHERPAALQSAHFCSPSAIRLRFGFAATRQESMERESKIKRVL
jgi:hypothetical protein